MTKVALAPISSSTGMPNLASATKSRTDSRSRKAAAFSSVPPVEKEVAASAPLRKGSGSGSRSPSLGAERSSAARRQGSRWLELLPLEEAGGKAARPHDGSPYRVDEWDRKGLVAAATPALWEAMAERLNALPA